MRWAARVVFVCKKSNLLADEQSMEKNESEFDMQSDAAHYFYNENALLARNYESPYI